VDAPNDPNARSLPQLYELLASGGLVRRLLELARDEDLGQAGDLTADAALAEAESLEARLNTRQPCNVAGLAAVPDLLEVFGGGVSWQPLRQDGEQAPAGTTLGVLLGPARSVVTVERTLLNLVGRLCGVATRTAEFIAEARLGSQDVCILDTRKTTPGLRVLEKYAVRCGGGDCHRLGLHDAVLVKDNHLAGVPDEQLGAHITGLVERARAGAAPWFVEIEVDRIEQLLAILKLPAGAVDYVLLDNMPPDVLTNAVALRDAAGSSIGLEASGGVSLETVRAIAASGVDRISVGSLTHGAVSIDVGLDA